MHFARKSNRLVNEKSPYLLQHAYNPVNWYPWGEEAFCTAKREDKPIFLSIGYSTCHWCHVMEKESFEDREVAELLNLDFIAIKVDREERPDIDSVYLSVCQALTGSGGWPLTILMTPDQLPFFAGTYFPKNRRHGMTGFIELLQRTAFLWKNDRQRLLSTGDDVRAYLEQQAKQLYHSAEPHPSLLHNAYQQLQNNFDKVNGGFGDAPKFPAPHILLFLLWYSGYVPESRSKKMVEKTLIQMYRGGLFDHIGGGFSRYSTDKKWLAPHFEKMLYDNALLAYTYLEAFRRTGKSLYEMVSKRTLDYLLRELGEKDGGFACGQDADSDGEEGKYYVWTPEEVNQILGPENGRVFSEWYGIIPNGNFEGKCIPNLLDNKQYEETPANISRDSDKIRSYRQSRNTLHRDDKILTSWNGLAICAFIKGYRFLNEEKYLHAAMQTRDFLLSKVQRKDGRLRIRWRDGEAAFDGQLDDYAFLSWSFLELYDTTFDASCLFESIRLTKMMMDLFWDNKHGGFYLTASDGEALISRPKEIYDGAVPSGNSVAALVLERIASFTGYLHWRQYADRQIEFLSGNISDYPVGFCFALLAVARALHPPSKLICVLPGEEIPTELFSFRDRSVNPIEILVKTPGNSSALSECAPYLVNYPIPEKAVQYYLCRNGTCHSPVSSLEDLKLL